MTTAKIEARTYVPYGIIAITFCRVNFSGDNYDSYDDIWHSIEFSEYNKYQPEVEKIEKEIGRIKLKKENEYKELSLWGKILVSILQNDCNSDECIDCLAVKLEDFKEKRWISASRLMTEAQYMLKENGFHLDSKSRTDLVEIEIWKKSN